MASCSPFLLPRRREHLHARALQIRAELTHGDRALRPTHSFWSFLFEKAPPPLHESVSRAAADGRRAECVCEAPQMYYLGLLVGSGAG